jgi:hypothetical protein
VSTRKSKTGGSAAGSRGLAELAAEIGSTEQRGLPPVHLWNPPFCGDLDMRIAADGTWFYMGTPIGRKRLVKLFSSVLRHDEDGKYYLVTPVEKIGITVDDAPFLAVQMAVDGSGGDQSISFRTNVDDLVQVGAGHPLRFEIEQGTGGLKPYVLVRGRLEALVNRAVFYDLVALGVEKTVDGTAMFGVWSGGRFWPMSKSSDMAAL